MPRYFGLDLHKRYVHGCEWLTEEQKGRHFRFPNTEDGWAAFVQQLEQECWVALEVTGNAFEAQDRLSPHAGKVLLANPLELKRLGSGRLTDRVDAERLDVAEEADAPIVATEWPEFERWIGTNCTESCGDPAYSSDGISWTQKRCDESVY